MRTSSSSPEERQALSAGQLIDGRYRIESHLADGGMGSVYRAAQLDPERRVALKLVRSHGGEAEPRFMREASLLSRLKHPHIVDVFEHGVDGEYCYIAMEFVDGRSLKQLLSEVGALPAARAVRIACRIAEAMEEAHRQDIVHRDLKPANVLLTSIGEDDDYVKVVDFGIGRTVDTDTMLTRSGELIGTPAFMAPEQIRGRDIGPWTDIYALGMMLYRMLTGVMPFESRELASVLVAQLLDDPPPMGLRAPNVAVPAALEEVVRACLRKVPAERMPSMTALRTALKAALEADASPAPCPVEVRVEELDESTRSLDTATLELPVLPPRRRWLPVGLFAGGAAAVALWLAWPEPPAPAAVARPPTLVAPPPVAAEAASAAIAPMEAASLQPSQEADDGEARPQPKPAAPPPTEPPVVATPAEAAPVEPVAAEPVAAEPAVDKEPVAAPQPDPPVAAEPTPGGDDWGGHARKRDAWEDP